jgi:hypothetical protein
MQLAPERPQALESVPARHRDVPPSVLQQPPGHSSGPHFVTLRPHTFLPSQNWKPFAMQSEQRWPAEPHARASAPMRHTPVASSQQPLGHVEGPHALPGGVMVPESNVSTSRLERPQPDASSTRNTVAKAASASRRAIDPARDRSLESESIEPATEGRRIT